ncbi:hypothetical protein AD47_4187 [Escherichia coli 6-319-05_S4_C3]|nr:hypothetical protein AD47_4187 [Escherichia coli 6-319-05_S4_C3]
MSTLCYVNKHNVSPCDTACTTAGNRQRKGTSAGSAPEPQGTRMNLVDIAILILKLIVAALQLLDAVLKYLK